MSDLALLLIPVEDSLIGTWGGWVGGAEMRNAELETVAFLRSPPESLR
jgi:hypothetical protein